MSSPRVASWIYDVINVLIDAHRAESGLLERGNTSWRFYNQQLEHVRPAGSYLTHNGQHILRDLIFAHPEVADWLRRHDDVRERLERTATDAYRSVVDAPGFQDRVEDARRRFLAQKPGAIPTGAFPAEKHPDLIAEHVVNQVRQLPQQYTDSEFWNAHGGEFLLAAPPLKDLDKARTEMLEFDREALTWLARLSFDLCKEFDVPAAPSGSFGY